MGFPIHTNYPDQNTQVVTLQTPKGFVTYINSLDGETNVFASPPVAGVKDAKASHSEHCEQVMKGLLGYFETKVIP